MALLDLQGMELPVEVMSGGYDRHDKHHSCGSGLSLLLCG
jgi:hypothetical protein